MENTKTNIQGSRISTKIYKNIAWGKRGDQKKRYNIGITGL